MHLVWNLSLVRPEQDLAILECFNWNMSIVSLGWIRGIREKIWIGFSYTLPFLSYRIFHCYQQRKTSYFLFFFSILLVSLEQDTIMVQTNFCHPWRNSKPTVEPLIKGFKSWLILICIMNIVSKYFEVSDSI